MNRKPLRPELLNYLSALKARRKLDANEMTTYEQLQRGFAGEEKFYQLLKPLEHLALFDLTFNIQGHEVQIDSLVFTAKTIYHFEVKNYQHDFKYGEGEWEMSGGRQILNPLSQLNRANILLNTMLKRFKIQQKLVSYLVFVDPDFYLQGGPRDLPIIYPNMLEKFLEYLSSKNPLEETGLVYRIRNEQVESHYKIPAGERFSDLVKGIFCKSCAVKLDKNSLRKFKCPSCLEEKLLVEALAEAGDDFRLIFPKKRLDKKNIVKWTGGMIHESTVKRFLRKHYKLEHRYRGSYYT